MAVITMESYSTGVTLQQCFPLCKVMYLLKHKPPGGKQLLLLHALIIQLRDLSLASVCAAFLNDSPFWHIRFFQGGYTMDVSGIFDLLCLPVCPSEAWHILAMLQKQVGFKASPTKRRQSIFIYREINLADYHNIRHTQITSCGPPAVADRWKDAREKVAFLVQSSLHIAPLSLLCISFLGYISFLCYSVLEGSHADEKPVVPVIILGKSKSGKILTDKLLYCIINPFTHTLNQSCVNIPHPYLWQLFALAPDGSGMVYSHWM